MKNKLATTVMISLALAGCDLAQMHKDNAGSPSPAVAMFAAQYDFATEVCTEVPEELESRRELTQRVLIQYRDVYMTYPSFTKSLGESKAKYRKAWDSAGAQGRAAFCRDYYQELETTTVSMASRRGEAFRSYFSPPSQAALERQASAGVLLGVASIAASAGSVAQVDNGNFAGAGRLNDAGQIMADAMSGNAPRAGYCRAYDHFMQAGAPASHGVWKRYQSLKSCP